MEEKILYSMESPFQQEFNVKGYYFGKNGGKKRSACIVGALRGTEYQQLYICSKLIDILKKIEKKGDIVGENGILVIPAVNRISMDYGKRFWISDDKDLNRLFPGSPNGESGSRVVHAIWETTKGYQYGIHLPSFYLGGTFIPHIRLLDPEHGSTSLANLFGLPYVIEAKTRPFDRTTLHYNWQKNGTEAFSLYTGATGQIDDELAVQAVSSILRFLTRMGIIRYYSHSGYIASVLKEEDLEPVMTRAAGLFIRKAECGQEVSRGDVLARIMEADSGEIISEVTAPTDGILFYAQTKPVVYSDLLAFQIIKRIHL
ncbi:MAG: M14 family metallopeptidase [Eubacterium sp.]|nr:M14 family metallopeptidase [Eubacterium sp.]MDY5497837.1 M14 family metallopeptidase [Anaerobutyricum sp.]